MAKKSTKQRKEKIALLPNQIKDLIKTIENSENRHNSRDKLMAGIWLATGFRVAELVNFKPDWIEISSNNFFIHIKENTKPWKFSPKYGSTRRIPITQDIYRKIKRHIGKRSEGYIFMPQSSKSYSRFHTKYIITLFNEYFKKTESIGRNIGSHTFRRTFASHLATSKPPVPITQISYYLGHRNIATTINYLKKIKTDDHSAIMNTDYIKKLIKF